MKVFLRGSQHSKYGYLLETNMQSSLQLLQLWFSERKKTMIYERHMVKMLLHIKPEFNNKLKIKIFHSPCFYSFLL